MAKVVVGPAGIETISGALMKPKKQEGHKCGNYLVATHRTAPTTSGNCQRLYAKRSDAYERSTSPGANELRARARFTAVAAAVKARSKNLSLMTSDQLPTAKRPSRRTTGRYVATSTTKSTVKANRRKAGKATERSSFFLLIYLHIYKKRASPKRDSLSY